MDTLYYNVRCEGRIVKKTIHSNRNQYGRIKEVLEMYVGENESAKYCLSILNGLKNRGGEGGGYFNHLYRRTNRIF